VRFAATPANTTVAAIAGPVSLGLATTWTHTPIDLSALIETLDLRDAILVGHSMGGGEVTRYICRHGTKRVAKVVLIGAIPPLMLKTAAMRVRTTDRQETDISQF
jgi:pimeloyl-ACP methyl ester carboxylesterase